MEQKHQLLYTTASEEASASGMGEEGVWCHGELFLLPCHPPSGLNWLLTCGVCGNAMNMELNWKTFDFATLMS